MIYFIILYSILKLYIILDIYQQSHYDIKSYFSYFISNILFYDLCPLVFVIFPLFFNNIVVDIICGIYLLLYSILSFIVKVKLKITRRIIRLTVISTLYIILLSLIPYFNNFGLLFIEFSIIPLLYLEIIFSNIHNKKYINNAKRVINSYSGTKIIITGSYGKTSTKSIMRQALSLYSSTIGTPKSYNTPLGISSFINDNPINAYSNLILEFGASKVNDITCLLEISKPDVAVVTEIGYMHMNGFKNIQNVINEKMKLIADADIAILNYDNEYIREYPKRNKVILSYGLLHGDYNARNITNGSFDFYFKNKFIMHFDTCLVGNHQILNSLAALSYIHYLNLDLNIIKKAFRSFVVEGKRLELKRIGNRVILDDSFNSNLVGFKEALKTLSGFNNKKVLLTPGIVELGKYKSMINDELALYISACTDVVILVGSKEVNSLYYSLKKYKLEIYRASSFLEGYNLYLGLIKGLDSSTLLIENDLTDLYKRRLLF